ncbi:MAG: hypothetical protein KDC87_02880, partial [Planctomycetes bacterium]|nr:hypothetical protein [Planctomycetota bacterium]
GNADYTIDEPLHYPFAFSDNRLLQWVNEQLIKAKPDFHKKTFLKPLHRTPEFCGTCHKVHLPKELNAYKWLRGQNHYDPFLLSGVSGHGIQSFYYPPKAETGCNGCHMPLRPSDDFGAKSRDASGLAKIHDHLFPSANTAIPVLEQRAGRLDQAAASAAVAAHREFNRGVMRIDLFGLRAEGRIDGALQAPLRPAVPQLLPGATYLLETVVRTLKMGHVFTQGTSDSNQVWVDVKVTIGDRLIGRSGGVRGEDLAVDPWSHFVQAFVIDRNGDRIARRNAEDIFVPLYNNQIPPGAADAVHYRLKLPDDASGTLRIDVKLRYRKFDTEYMRFVTGDPKYRNDLPVMTLAEDSLTLPIRSAPPSTAPAPNIPEWQRWNDYGIGLLRKGGNGQLRQAEQAFQRVEALGRADGPLNLARVYLREGRVATEAPAALRRARDAEPRAAEWSLLWFSGLVHQGNGALDAAIRDFEQILAGGFAQAQGRGFDFTRDYNLLNQLGQTLFDRAKQERGAARSKERDRWLHRARDRFEQTLAIDPENSAAHYGLQQVFGELGDTERARRHADSYEFYRVDDNARDTAIANARRKYPAANHAAEAVVIYDLHREGAFTGDLPDAPR